MSLGSFLDPALNEVVLFSDYIVASEAWGSLSTIEDSTAGERIHTQIQELDRVAWFGPGVHLQIEAKVMEGKHYFTLYFPICMSLVSLSWVAALARFSSTLLHRMVRAGILAFFDIREKWFSVSL